MSRSPRRALPRRGIAPRTSTSPRPPWRRGGRRLLGHGGRAVAGAARAHREDSTWAVASTAAGSIPDSARSTCREPERVTFTINAQPLAGPIGLRVDLLKNGHVIGGVSGTPIPGAPLTFASDLTDGFHVVKINSSPTSGRGTFQLALETPGSFAGGVVVGGYLAATAAATACPASAHSACRDPVRDRQAVRPHRVSAERRRRPRPAPHELQAGDASRRRQRQLRQRAPCRRAAPPVPSTSAGTSMPSPPAATAAARRRFAASRAPINRRRRAT